MKSVAKARQCERDDDLLSRPGLRAGAGLQTPLEQRRIGAREVEADDVRADGEDQDEGPASPVHNGSGRSKNQDAEDEEADDGALEHAKGELHHVLSNLMTNRR